MSGVSKKWLRRYVTASMALVGGAVVLWMASNNPSFPWHPEDGELP